MDFLKKTFVFITLVVSGQLLLMLLAFLFFDINLFELEKNEGTDVLSQLSLPQLKFFVSLNQFIGMLLPALMYLLIIRVQNLGKWIGSNALPDVRLILLSITILLFSYPAIAFLMEINLTLDIPSWMDQAAVEIEEQMSMIISMDGYGDLVINLLLIAFLPSIAEELFFRGVIQNEFKNFFKNGHAAVWITAILFSAIHLQFDGFLPRLGLGLLLGYCYLFTHNFLIPILLHFINNGIMVMSVYFNNGIVDELAAKEIPSLNLVVVSISFLIVLYLLFVLKKKNKEYGFKETV